ncbi:MAG: hypothetical protein ACP5O7_13565, partial [Phycisphaerae bacterium]
AEVMFALGLRADITVTPLDSSHGSAALRAKPSPHRPKQIHQDISVVLGALGGKIVAQRHNIKKMKTSAANSAALRAIPPSL